MATNAQPDGGIDEAEVQKQFDFMMSDVLKERKKHMLASLHYNKLGSVTFLFSALITLSQAFLASFSQADLVPGEQGEALHDKREAEISARINLSIACLAAFSVFIQSLIKNWNFKGKATLHDSAAAALGKIYKTARLKARKKAAGVDDDDRNLKRKPSNLSNSMVSLPGNPLGTTGHTAESDGTQSPAAATADVVQEDSTHTNLLETLVAQFEQATESCTSLVPAKINSAFDLLDNKIEVSKRKVRDVDEDKEKQTKIKWESVYSTLYRELTAVIISQPMWPYKIPDPKKVVKETMENYRKMGKMGEKGDGEDLLLLTLLERNEYIKEKYEAYENCALKASASETPKSS